MINTKIDFMVCRKVQRISLKFSYAERVEKEYGWRKKNSENYATVNIWSNQYMNKRNIF